MHPAVPLEHPTGGIMTIVVRRREKLSKVQRAVREAAEVSRNTPNSMDEFLIKKEKEKDRLKGAAIRRYAKKHGLALEHHTASWMFRARSGEKIILSAGYYVRSDGVLQDIVAK